MLVPILPPPGVVKEPTEYSAGLRWTDSNLIRFRNGLPEHIGGWNKVTTTLLDSPARSLFPFKELNGIRNIAFGTSSYLNIYQGGTMYDITPYRTIDQALANNPFTTTISTSIVTVSHTNHGAVSGDRVTFSGATTFNNVTVDGTYTLTYVDLNSYTIVVSTTASASGSGGGAAVLASYSINSTASSDVAGRGWGAGRWGESFWGTPRTSSGITLESQRWSFDGWGEDLIAGARNGKIYLWDASLGPTTRAAAIAGAPSQVGSVAVTEERYLVAFGAHDGTSFNPMLVRWSDQEDYSTWTPAITNTAGDYLLDEGTKIIAHVKARGQILIFTDTAVYSMQLIDTNHIFGFFKIATNCGIIGPHAVTSFLGNVVWVSNNVFYIYDGGVRPLPCTVQSFFFEGIDSNHLTKTTLGLNPAFSEIFFFYQSKTSTNDVDKYIKWNYIENVWDVGTMGRTVWYPPQSGFSNPIAVAPDGSIYYHELGLDNDTAAFNAWIETGVLEMESPQGGLGDDVLFLDRAVPDNYLASGKSLQFTVYCRIFPNDSDEIVKGPFTITSSTKKVDTRARGRQFRFRFESSDTENRWRLGKWRVDIIPDGGR